MAEILFLTLTIAVGTAMWWGVNLAVYIGGWVVRTWEQFLAKDRPRYHHGTDAKGRNKVLHRL
jgi:uncharacterized membrane protein YczE